MILNSQPLPLRRPGRKRRRDRELRPIKKAAVGNPYGSLEQRFAWMRAKQAGKREQ